MKMRKILSLVFAGFLFLGGLFAQEVLNNDSIIKLVSSGLGENVIVNIVKMQPGRYAVAPDELILLKKFGVSEKIIAAMLAKSTRTPEPKGEDKSDPSLHAQKSERGPLTDADVINMIKAGLDESTIVLAIHRGPTDFDTSAEALVSLKKGGATQKILDAMLTASTETTLSPQATTQQDTEGVDSEGIGKWKVLKDEVSPMDGSRTASGSSPAPVSPARVTVSKKGGPVTNQDTVGGEQLVSSDHDLRIPSEAGLYALGPTQGLERIEGRATSFVRTGSCLASAATLGIHANRVNTQIPGSRANVTLGPTPTFYYRPVKDEGGLDLILTRLTVKNGRRQFEVGAQGIFRASKGVSVRHQMDFDADEVEPGLYRLVLTHQLKAGQYAFYLLRGFEHSSTEEGSGFVYCFQVE
jgi:hypothetical protein